MNSNSPTTLRQACLVPLLCPDAEQKALLVEAIDASLPIGVDVTIEEPSGVPGRPLRPELVSPTKLKPRDVQNTEGRATLIHALAHIELNAIDLALDLLWRFAGMPRDFYLQWLNVAKEEARHFQLLNHHLKQLGYCYGDFPAHGALWEMAEKTKGNLLARLALVPRTLEARGLDASPLIRAKLWNAGDKRGAEILDTILQDEIGHVATGNRWFNYLCAELKLDPVQAYEGLAERYKAPKLRSPFNIEARRAAGFSNVEIEALTKR